jgi:hemolysin D
LRAKRSNPGTARKIWIARGFAPRNDGGVSQDAIVRDKPNAKAGDKKVGGALSDSSEPDGQELLYSARVSLDGSKMQVEDKMVNLVPGVAVTVEIKTGSRRLIEYLMSPLLRYRHESLRER